MVKMRSIVLSELKLWWKAVRAFSFTVSILPPILGAIVADFEVVNFSINIPIFILTIVASVMAHAGANLFNDYFDYKKGVDRVGTFGSSGLLVARELPPSKILIGGVIAFAIALLIGVYFIFSLPNGFYLLYPVGIGALFAFFYTAPPFQLKYRALGDVAVLLSFGPIMAFGAYYIQVQQFSWTPVLFSLPLALLANAVLHGNNLRDFEDDIVAKIKTLPIIIGENAGKKMYYFLVGGAYLATIALVFTTQLPYASLITLFSFPVALKVMSMVKSKDSIPRDIFATIDERTAQLHLLFGVLFVIPILIHSLV